MNDIYAHAFDRAFTGLVVLEAATGRILHANAAFLRMAGFEAVTGLVFWEPPLIADKAAGAEVHAHLATGGAVAGAQLPMCTPGGRWRVLEVSGSIDDSRIFLEILDATSREKERHAARMETLREFAARTAIEFRNLHTSLLAAGEVLLIAAGQGRPVLRDLDEVRQSSERAAGIASALTAFSGQLELQPRRVDLKDLVDSLIPKLRELFMPEVEIVADLDAEPALVVADPVRVRQIVLKLAENARDAMGAHGTFCIQVRGQAALEPGMETESGTAAAFAMLAISDSGPGFEDRSWQHLYEPFSTTKQNGKSLGLGLASVYGMVRQSGGKLWAYSQPGQGATFRVYLPAWSEQFPAPPLEAVRAQAGATILLVEPNDAMRTGIANLLKKSGYRVWPVLHALEALRVCEAQGWPDLLISRPEPSLAKEMLRFQPQLRILFLGGYGEGLLAEEHGLPPRTALLPRPFEPETLLDQVRKLLL